MEPLEVRRVLAINVAVVQDISFGDTAGFVATRDQLNNDTFFDFNASLVSASQVDTLAELSAFDVVIIGDNGYGNPDAFSNLAFTAALRNWVENHAGGVVMTGWGVFGAGAGTPPPNPDIDAIIPVNTLGGYNYFSASVNIDIVATHPITTGLGPSLLITASGPNGNYVEFPTSPPQLDPGATLLGQISGQPVIAAGNKGTGRGVYLGPIYAGTGQYSNGTLRSGSPDRLLEQSVAWAAGAMAPAASAKVYRTSLDSGLQPFDAYDVATNTWTNLGSVDTAGQMAVSGAGELFMLQRTSNTIQKYNPGTNTWTSVMPGPSGSHIYGNLEITSSGEFLFSELNSNILHYTVGGIAGVWQQFFMPAAASALGDYDPITNDIFIVHSGSEVVRSIDVSTFSQTVYSAGAGTSGEIRRFGDILNGKFYQLRDSAPPKFYDIGNPAAPLTTMAPLPIDAIWESAAVDDANGIMYLNNLFGTGAFSRWDPATNSQVLLATPPSSLGNHSSLAFVSSFNQPPMAPVDSNSAANSIAEGAPNGTPVGITAFSTDPNGQTPIYSLTNNAGGRFAINSATGVVSAANSALLDGPGSHMIEVQASDGVGGISSALFSITVTNVNPTASLNAPASVVYGNGVNVSLTGASDVSAADVASLHYAFGFATTNSSPLTGINYAGSSTAASDSFASLNAGSYWVFARVIDKDGGYTEYSQQVTVDQADAQVNINSYSGTYDAAAHNLTGSVVGVASDLAAAGSSLTFGPSFTDAGSHTGTWTFEGGINYLDESGTATIDIAKADANVTVNGYTGVYDAAAHGATGSATGVGGVDMSAGLNLGASFTDVPGGTAHWTFDGGINYEDESGSVAIDIAKADANVTVNGYSGVYDAAAHGATGNATGVGGVDLSAGLNLGASFTDVPGGTGSWTFEGGINYLDESGTATIDIAKADANVTVNGYTGVYDAAAHGATGSATGVGGVDLSAGLNLGASFTDVPGGTAHWTFEGGINYKDQSGTAPIDIAKAAISHTIGNAMHVYGSTVDLEAVLGATFLTGVNGETLAIAYASAGNTVLANAGSYAITGAVSDGSGLESNYAVTLTPGTLSVDQAILTGDATTQDALNMAKQGKLTITISNVAGLLNGDTLTNFLSTAEYYITVGTNRYAFVPTTVTTSGSSITVAYTLKNSALVTQLAAELTDNTSGATAVTSGFSMESLNYLFIDDYLTRLFSTAH